MQTPEELYTPQPSSSKDTDKQVSKILPSKGAAFGSKLTNTSDIKSHNSFSSDEACFIRPSQECTQYQIIDACTNTKNHGVFKSFQGNSSLPISVRDLGLSLSESDQAKTGQEIPDTDLLELSMMEDDKRFQSIEKNMKPHVVSYGNLENVPFIDDIEDGEELRGILAANSSVSVGLEEAGRYYKEGNLTSDNRNVMVKDKGSCSSDLERSLTCMGDTTDFRENMLHRSFENEHKTTCLFVKCGCRALSTDYETLVYSEALRKCIQIKSEDRSLSPGMSDIDCDELMLEELASNQRAYLSNSTQNHGYTEGDYRPESQNSQCSFSFLDLALSEPIRAKLMSQFCDYYLEYGKEILSPVIVSSPDYTDYITKKNLRRSLTPDLEVSKDSPSDLQESLPPKGFLPPQSQLMNKEIDYRQNSLNSSLPPVTKSWHEGNTSQTDENVEPLFRRTLSTAKYSADLNDRIGSIKSVPENILPPGQRSNDFENNFEHNPEISDLSKSMKVHVKEDHEKHNAEGFDRFKQSQSSKPFVFNLVEKQNYVLNFAVTERVDDFWKNRNTEYKGTENTIAEPLQNKETHERVSFTAQNQPQIQSLTHTTVSKVMQSEPTKEMQQYEKTVDSSESISIHFEPGCKDLSDTFCLAPAVERPLTYAEVVQGYAQKGHSNLLSGKMALEINPFCLLSISPGDVGSDSYIDHSFLEFRPQSPASVKSQSDCRALSPDSPIPQFSCPQFTSEMVVSRPRSFTPESLASDWDDSGLCPETLFDQSRPESPQPVSSDMRLKEVEKIFSYRPLSPESVSINCDFSLFTDGY